MRIWAIFIQSLKALFVNKARSLLTILGIVIGIGSVIGLVSLGTGVKASISDRILALGATNLTIIPGAGIGPHAFNPNQAPPSGGGFGMSVSTLSEKDLKSLADRKKHPLIQYISGQITGSTVLETAGGNRRYPVLGTSHEYFAIENLALKQGRFFQADEAEEDSRVVVLGRQMADEIFQGKNPVGKKLKLGTSDYTIIGVLRQADETGITNPNLQAYIPYTAAAETFKSSNFNSIYVKATSEDVVNDLKQDITRTIMANHNITDESLADFSVFSSADLLSAVSSITTMLTSLLAGIAAISLLVGGIGIMNIMLVSVTERTREIGLRKAVGARTIDILNQFLIEAILLTVTGGLFGIGLGIMIGRVSEPYLGFTPIVTGGSIALAVGVSGAVGLLFGVYPAVKASRLNPIDALRYE